MTEGAVGLRVVVVGAGHAGGSAVAFLRQFGFAGAITLVGDEPIAPYHRPPLSKAWLKGEADANSLALKPESFYGEQNIDLRLSTHAVSIDRAAKTVALGDGSTIAYDFLILATGARARRLTIPGATLGNMLELRNAADAEQIKALLGPGKRLAIVGGGYIGLEVAASARALGAEAVIIEREVRVLARVACLPLSTFFQDYHRARGVTFELDAGVQAFEGEANVTGVRLSDGRVLPCDAALVGIGAIPNDEIASSAGLACDGGIVVDLQARTSDPAIFAVGDVTRRPLPHYDNRMHRLESVPNALEQAKQAASAIVGKAAPNPEVPWFWSDQFDLKLQIAGLPFDADRIVVRGNPADAKFAVFHLKGDVVQAVEAVNAPPEFMMGKNLIGSRKPVSVDKLGNPAVSMKEVAA